MWVWREIWWTACWPQPVSRVIWMWCVCWSTATMQMWRTLRSTAMSSLSSVDCRCMQLHKPVRRQNYSRTHSALIAKHEESDFQFLLCYVRNYIWHPTQFKKHPTASAMALRHQQMFIFPAVPGCALSVCFLKIVCKKNWRVNNNDNNTANFLGDSKMLYKERKT